MKTLSLMAVRALALGFVTAALFGMPYCWIAGWTQRFAVAAVLTVLFGRFFCSALCPLGILQSLVAYLRHPRTSVRRVCTRLPESRVQQAVRWSVAGVTGAGLLAGWGAASLPLPMSVYGKAISGWWPGIAMLAFVLALAVFGRGRIWCNWICPYGTVFNLLVKFAVLKNRVGGGCGNCRRCFETPAPAKAPADSVAATRRDTLKGVTVLAAEKLTDGGMAAVSEPGLPERAQAVLPPGAESREAMARKCVGCQLCVTYCPGKCLKPSTSLRDFGMPVMDFRHGYCLLNCAACSRVCPEGALKPIQREQRPNVHLGQAIWRRELCVRTANGDQCTACVRKCPVQAIHLVQGFPVVDRDKCIGCGACEHVCPARPQPAIFVEGFDRQRVVNPISEADLKAEMRSRIDAGAAIVVARGGVIVAERRGRGIGPVLELMDAGMLRDSVVMDKVVGRASAAICVLGHAKEVSTLLAGKGAAELLARHGIPLRAVNTVEVILNHERSGSCPMEQATVGLDNPEQMVAAIRKARQKF